MIKIKLNRQENTVNLAASLAEELASIEVIPIIKNNEIILDDSSLGKTLSIEEALPFIRRSLERSKTKYRCIYVKDAT